MADVTNNQKQVTRGNIPQSGKTAYFYSRKITFL
jgi:hypothetical protein